MNTDTVPLNDRQQEMQVLHSQWLAHPCTKAALEILIKHEKFIADFIANSSSSETVTDSKIRQYAVQLKTCQVVQTMLFDSQVFVSKLQ